MLLALLVPLLVLASPPLDCDSTPDASERLICADPLLRAQQSMEQALYAAARNELPTAQRAAQQEREALWRHERAACARAENPRRCLTDQLSRRLVELQITLKRVPVLAAVIYRCEGAEGAQLLASYYRTEPAAVHLQYLDQEVLAFIAAAASGARYLGDDVEFWEHQGVARLTWHGRQMSCPKQ